MSSRDEKVYREIVGIVRDVKYFGASDSARALVWVPYAQEAWGARASSRFVHVAIHLNVLPMVRAELRSLDPGVALANVATMADAMSRSMAGDRLLAVLLGAFASLALLLAAVGIFGVLSYMTERRCTNWAFVSPSVRSASTWCDARAGASRIERRPDHRIARRVAGGSVRAAKPTAGVTTTRRITGRRQILT